MKQLVNCKHCGRQYTYNGKNSKDYCDKHRHQLEIYGKFLDCNPRTKYDPNEFRIKGSIVEMDTYTPIYGTIKNTYIFDTEDLLTVSQYKWYSNKAGYAMTRDTQRKPLFLHRLVMKAYDGQTVDHINTNILDNRKINLRITSKSVQSSDRNSYNKYGVNGVEQNKIGKWSAYFRTRNKQYHSPCYNTIEEAAFARYLLEQRFSNDTFIQCNIALIEKLSESQKESIIHTINEKFKV